MKKYFIVEEWYTKEKNTVFEFMNIDTTYDYEIFDSLEECREFCKKKNIKTYVICEGSLYHYWIEEREVDKNNEIISDNFEYYDITADVDNEILIYDYNTEQYEIVDNIYGYDNIFKVAKQLFMKNASRNNFYYVYSGYVIRCCTLDYHGHHIMNINDSISLINKLKELGVYNDIIHDYMSGIKEVIFVKSFSKK